MNKKDLASRVADELGMQKSDAIKAVNMVFDSISTQLERGREVKIHGFGVFKVESVRMVVKLGRSTRSPTTERLVRVPEFRASSVLSKQVEK